MSTWIKVLALVVVVAVVAQVALLDFEAPADQGRMIVGGEAGPIFEAACADCHTHDTTWPWYSKVPPLSFWVYRHVQEGREHFNLSTWDAYDTEEADHKLEEMIEMVEEEEMPLNSYTWGHPEARLSFEQRQALIAWAEEMRAGLAREMAPEPGPATDEVGDSMGASEGS